MTKLIINRLLQIECNTLLAYCPTVTETGISLMAMHKAQLKFLLRSKMHNSETDTVVVASIYVEEGCYPTK